ncbi:glutathione S-transferase family protein [Pseudooceanicola nanhaiensis]|jgi:glutathione S-transferase|uniref:glutathione transferase n=1 Tax=Pseudooceanicola nanhaiensis TaxID=375761 RepID=A0A917T911_9RHOB|nr:glutathione S-transferase [Pseudooceanicola nanhaiensis]GGM12154.1 glutathione S-transferase [Pseudooceanicola nanhaiensis]
MKLYDYKMAPNCRRVRFFAAEKGVSLECVDVDLMTREQLGDAYVAVNERRTVPLLELDDGTRLTESVAICRYLEETTPEPALFGTGALGKARVEMWHRRVELEGLMAVAEALRNTSEGFRDRAIPGPQNFPQIPELAERGQRRLDAFYAMLDARLGESRYLAGEDFSIADILGVVTVDFAKAVKRRIPEEATNLARWHAEVSARPAAKA